MQLDDYTASGLLRRWYLLEGQPRCPLDAVDPKALPSSTVSMILTSNALVRAKVEAVEAYEAAQRVFAGEEPEETIDGTDDDGDPIDLPNPAHAAWTAAADLIESASAETVALANRRAGVFPLGDDGNPIEPEPDPLPVDDLGPAMAAQALYNACVDRAQARLDAFAQTRGYADILSAATYATSTVPKFLAEGQCAVDLRDQTWAALWELLAAVQAGTVPMPTSPADIDDYLPDLTWPD